ncbi:hypothetical protein ACFL35_04730 [Candidatus Riflebacteria bacterium]
MNFRQNNHITHILFVITFFLLNMNPGLEAAVGNTLVGFAGVAAGAQGGAIAGASLGAALGPLGVIVGGIGGAIGGGLVGGAVGGRVGAELDKRVSMKEGKGAIAGGLLGAGIGACILPPIGMIAGGILGAYYGKKLTTTHDMLLTPQTAGAGAGAKLGSIYGEAGKSGLDGFLGKIQGGVRGMAMGQKVGAFFERLFGDTAGFFEQKRTPPRRVKEDSFGKDIMDLKDSGLNMLDSIFKNNKKIFSEDD